MASKLLTQHLVASSKPGDKPYEIRDSKVCGLILRVQPSSRQYYYVEYARKKRRSIGRADSLTLTQARRAALEALAKPAEQAPKPKQITLGGFIEHHYRPWATAELKTGGDIVRRINACFNEFHNCKLVDINPWIVEKWRAKRLKAGKKITTVNRDITALKAALQKAVTWEMLESNPLVSIKPKRTDATGHVRYLDQDEEMRLRAALDARDARIRKGRASGNAWRNQRGYPELATVSSAFADHLKPLVLLALNTGMRRGELLGLRWEDVNLGRQTATVRGSSAKSGKTRHLPLNHEAQDTLRDWKKQTDGKGLVFGGLTHFKRSWGNLLQQAEIEGFRFHDCRHHFASSLVMAGADLNTVRELLGHGDIKMTLRYAHLAPEHKAAVVALLNR